MTGISLTLSMSSPLTHSPTQLLPPVVSCLRSIKGLLAAPKVHFSIGVDLGITHGRAALGKKHLHGGSVPAEHGEVNGADGREEVFAGSAVVHADETH